MKIAHQVLKLCRTLKRKPRVSATGREVTLFTIAVATLDSGVAPAMGGGAQCCSSSMTADGASFLRVPHVVYSQSAAHAHQHVEQQL